MAVVVSYSVLNFVIQSIIQPKFAGDAVGLTPTMSFVSLLLWGWVFFGALGTLIALPCSLLVKATLIDHDPGARWVNALISSRPQKGLRTTSMSSMPVVFGRADRERLWNCRAHRVDSGP
ncbi:permease [Cutibacterium acnes JCM 18909]|nr:permease [Cutibacterium acnes JCM 18909]